METFPNYTDILYAKANGIATLTINGPQAYNAFTANTFHVPAVNLKNQIQTGKKITTELMKNQKKERIEVLDAANWDSRGISLRVGCPWSARLSSGKELTRNPPVT